MDLALQGHQLAVRTALARPQSDRFSYLVVHGTGLGKSVTVINVAEDFLGPFRGRALYVAPEITHHQFVQQVLVARRSRYPAADPATVAKRYTAVTYESLGKIRPEDYDVLIFDEAHKLRSPDTDLARTFEAMREAFAPRTRLAVFLTATPMYDDADDIFPLLSFAAWNDGRTSLANRLAKKDALALADAARRYVSYSDTRDPASFPRELPPPDGFRPRIARPWARQLPFPVLQVPTSRKHAELLDRVAKEHGELAAAPHALVEWGDESEPRPGARALQRLVRELPERAPKIHALLEALDKMPGPAIVYCRYVARGAVPVAAALEARGYQRLTQTRASMLPEGARRAKARGKRYAVLTSSRTASDPVPSALRAFAAGNLDVAIITASASEGLSFRGARQVHVLDTWWNVSLLQQVLGRGIRYKSHHHLPPDQRDCRVFVYCATRDDGKETPDETHLRHAAAKFRLAERHRDVLRRHAADCADLAPDAKRTCADPRASFLRGSGEGVVRELFDAMDLRVRAWARETPLDGKKHALDALAAAFAREDLGGDTPATREAFRLAVLASAFPRWVTEDRAVLVTGDHATVITPPRPILRTVDISVADPRRHGTEQNRDLSLPALRALSEAPGLPDAIVALAALAHVGAQRVPALAETLSWVGDGELTKLTAALRRVGVIVAREGGEEVLRDPFDARGDGGWVIRGHALPVREKQNDDGVLEVLRREADKAVGGTDGGTDFPRGSLRLDVATGKGGLYVVTHGGTPGGRESRTFPVAQQWDILRELDPKSRGEDAFRKHAGNRMATLLAALHAAGRLRIEVL